MKLQKANNQLKLPNRLLPKIGAGVLTLTTLFWGVGCPQPTDSGTEQQVQDMVFKYENLEFIIKANAVNKYKNDPDIRFIVPSLEWAYTYNKFSSFIQSKSKISVIVEPLEVNDNAIIDLDTCTIKVNSNKISKVMGLIGYIDSGLGSLIAIENTANNAKKNGVASLNSKKFAKQVAAQAKLNKTAISQKKALDKLTHQYS